MCCFSAIADVVGGTQLAVLDLGSEPVESSSDTVTTRSLYTVPDQPLMTSSGNDSLEVDFGSEIASTYVFIS